MPTVYITGSARRIGKGLAIEFAKKGFDVVIHYNNSPIGDVERVLAEVKSYGVKCVAVKADLQDEAQVVKAFAQALEAIGEINVLINNSGVFPARKSLLDTSLAEWDTAMNINLRGQFIMAREFAKQATQGSRIINIASLGGLEIWKNRIPYNVSKAGIIQLTKALARELAPKISVNCVCPGVINIPEEPADSVISSDKIPMGRFGNLQDLFDAVYFFASASCYITSQILCVDGGYHDAR